MRKVTREIANAFARKRSRTIGNTHTDGESVWLHGNEIARRVNFDGREALALTMAGWPTVTTRERLNGIAEDWFDERPFFQSKHEQYCETVDRLRIDDRDWLIFTRDDLGKVHFARVDRRDFYEMFD